MKLSSGPWIVLSALALSTAFACGGPGQAEDADDSGDAGAGGFSAAGAGGRSSTSGAGGKASTGGKSGQAGSSGKAGSGGRGGTGGQAGSNGSAGEDGTTGGSSSAGSGTGGANGACASDSCPFPNGVNSECRMRFMYGVNYAWQNFAADFGGGNRGVAANIGTVRTQLEQMSSNGVSVVRWWVWPNFTGNGVSFDGSGSPTGLTSTTEADLEAALAEAEAHDLYLMLTLFSFDNFKSNLPDNRSLATIGVNANQRAALVNNVVRPFARAASMSPNAKRVIAWDVINEPEWAVTGASLYGDEPFDPDSTCRPITHAQMETLLGDVIAGLRAESSALVTIGAAAMKWRNAWTRLDQDFYQFHIYDWVHEYWPYSDSPSDYGMADKPVVMGEFPPEGVGDADYRTLLDSWYSNGYAGALAWRDATFRVDYSEVRAFADAHPCETAY
jgi:hypothetical protein